MFEKCDPRSEDSGIDRARSKGTGLGEFRKRQAPDLQDGQQQNKKSVVHARAVSIQYNPVIHAMYKRLKKNGKNGKVNARSVVLFSTTRLTLPSPSRNESVNVLSVAWKARRSLSAQDVVNLGFVDVHNVLDIADLRRLSRQCSQIVS